MAERKVKMDWEDKWAIGVNRVFAGLGGVGLGTSVSYLFNPNFPRQLAALGIPAALITFYGAKFASIVEDRLKREGKI